MRHPLDPLLRRVGSENRHFHESTLLALCQNRIRHDEAILVGGALIPRETVKAHEVFVLRALRRSLFVKSSSFERFQ